MKDLGVKVLLATFPPDVRQLIYFRLLVERNWDLTASVLNLYIRKGILLLRCICCISKS